jgi:RsiW-degrading membrane proteinase PrsW (M82 family)
VAEQAALVDRPSTAARRSLREILAPDLWTTVANVSLGVAALLLLLAIPHFVREGTDEFVADVLQHAYVFVLLIAVTILGRTLPLRMLAAFFFIGMFLVTSVMLLLAGVLDDVFGSGRMFDSFAVPVLEESVKAIPIALLFWFMIRRGWQPSITDGLLLGFVLGAGLAIHEDAIYVRVYGEGTDDSLLGLIFPTIGRQSTLSRVEVYGFFHSGWGSLLGLTIGASFMFGRRFRAAYLIGIVGFLVVVLDHAIGNLIIENQGPGDLGLLWTLDLNGMLPVYLLLLGIPGAVAFEIVVLRRLATIPALPSLSLREVLPWLGRGLNGLLRVQAARRYTRARRALQYLLWSGRAASQRQAARDQVLRAVAASRDAGLEAFVPPERMSA